MEQSDFFTLENAESIQNIKRIFIPRVDFNYYQFICDYIQTLAIIIGSGNKLNCPVYMNDLKYKEGIIKFFTSGEILQYPRCPATVTDNGTLWLHNYLGPAHPKGLTLAKKIIRAQLPLITAEQVVIIQRKHYRKIENLNNIISLTENILKIKPIIFYPEENTIEKTAEIFQSTKVLIAPHGAGLANTIFMQDNTYVIEIFPPEWNCYTFKSFIECLNSNIHHERVVQQVNQEYLYKYPIDFTEYRRKQPHEVLDRSKHAEYFRAAKDCTLTNGSFPVDERQFEQVLKSIFLKFAVQ